MKRQWLIVAVVVAVLTGGAVVAVRLSPDIFPVEVGSMAPDFAAVDINSGDTVRLADYRDHVVLLNIWATWCAPCIEEMPSIQRLHDRFGSEGLRVVAVSVDESDPGVVREFQRRFGLTFDILQDRSRAIERIYQATGVPESFVLNREGRISKKMIGAHDWDSPTNQDLVRRLLAQRR